MRSNCRSLLALSFILAAAVVPCTAKAQLVEVAYSGVITSVTSHPLFGALQVGDSFWGGFRYNLATPDTDVRSGFGYYENSNTQFFVDFGAGKGGLFSQSGNQTYNNIQIGNDRTDAGNEPFDGFYAYGNMEVAGYSYVESGISLQSMLNPLSSEGLPMSGLDWSKFLGAAGGPHSSAGIVMGAAMEFHAIFGDGCTEQWYDDCSGSAYGEITQISVRSVVPEPGSALLVLTGFCGIALFARRRRLFRD